MELSRSPRTQTTNNAPKPWATSFFPLLLLLPAVHLAHLEEEDTRRDKDKGSADPNGIDRVTEEFMVYLARAVKDAQTEKKHCYHCSSLEHFIHNCLLMKALRENMQLNSKEGMALKKGAWTPPTTAITPKNLQAEVPKA